ncbi:hypothetical protein FJY70_01235 [candidate division WOR-3 bacterium]|nr:hypothetical protein [candidate division WOR-3 bacterium]
MVGLLFLSLAASASYSNSVLSAVRGRVYFRLPGASAQDYSVFSIYWLVLGLPVLMLVVGLCFRPFRAALTSAWRKRGTAAALVMTLVVLGFSLIPWEPKIENPAYGASRIVLCLILGSVGFVWFVAGIYHRLGFLETATRGCYNWLMSLDRRVFLLLAAGFTFVVANAVSWLVFFHLPQVADSISQVFQARIFASGRLWLPAPQFPDFFDYTHIINVAGSTGHPASGFAASDWPGPLGRWYSQYPFLHPLLLTLGVLLGAPWLVNPLLGALTVVAVYYLGCEVYDERSGRLGALLACVSPFIFNMSGEFMNHASALLFATLFMLFWFRAFVPSAGKAERGTWRSALLAGLFIGLVADIRPYTAAALALPFAVYSLVRAVARPRLYLGRLLALALAGAAAAGLVLIYNALTNGHPLLFGYVVKYGAGHEIGFGHSAWGQSHTPWRGLVNVGHDLNMLNRFLFEWPVPSLAVVLLVFLTGKASKPDWLLLAAFVGLPVAYFFYWFHQACFGPRFLYEASACLVLLTVRSGQSLGLLLRRVFGRDASDRSAAGLVARVLPLLLFWMLTVNLPPLLRSYRNPALVNYQPVARARQAKLENALVFCNDFGNGFTANPLDRNGPVVYARDYGRLNSALTLAYPGRDYYYANRDTLRRLVGLDYPQSELRQVLDAMAQALADTVIAPYRTLLWPFRDIPPAGVDPEFVSLHLADYRELSRELFTGRRELDDYLPALACWLVKDKREHLAVFSFMDELQNYIAEPYKFTLVYVNEDQTAAYYDIRRTTGGELLDEEQPDH